MNKLRMLEVLTEINKKIEDLKNELKISIGIDNAQIQHKGDFIIKSPPINETQQEVNSNKIQEDFIELQKMLNSKEWPESVLDFQIVNENSEEEKMHRAEGIVSSIISETFENKRILDFGCGEGHVSKYISEEKATISVGYDINKSEVSKFNWNKKENNFLLTDDFEKVKIEGPYDIIILYDVIDHLTEDASSVLIKLKDLLSDNGKIYIRCHPWCSRHGGHLYRKINKAFVHLIFTEEELHSMGYNIEDPNLKVIFPISTYEEILKKSQLKKVSADVERQKVESFFSSNELVKNRIVKIFKSNSFPSFQMEQCFIDYKLVNE